MCEQLLDEIYVCVCVCVGGRKEGKKSYQFMVEMIMDKSGNVMQLFRVNYRNGNCGNV